MNPETDERFKHLAAKIECLYFEIERLRAGLRKIGRHGGADIREMVKHILAGAT